MVRLFRGARGRGGHGDMMRPPFMGLRQRPLGPNFQPPFTRPVMRGRLLRGHPVQPRLERPPLGLGFPSGLPPRTPGRPLPPRPHPGLPPRPLPPGSLRMPPRPVHFPRPGPPPPFPPRPMLPGPPRPGFPIRIPGPPLRGMPRGRGRMLRGTGLKRLGAAANGKTKKVQKRKEKTEEMELKEPWVTEALKVEIKKKYELQNIAKEKKNDNDCWQAFKDQRSLVQKMVNAAKLEYIGSHPESDVDKIMAAVAAEATATE